MIYRPSELYVISLAEKIDHKEGSISYLQNPKLYFATKLNYNISIAPSAESFKLISNGLKFSTDKIYLLSKQFFVVKFAKATKLLPELANFKLITTSKLLEFENNQLSCIHSDESPKIQESIVPQIVY